MLFELFLCFYALEWAVALEEPVREQHLEPRHFNPHPYRGARKRTKTGPVIFPYEEDARQFVKIDSLPQQVPYRRVAEKYKKKKFGRYDVSDEKINPRLEHALAEHGAKVLQLPPENLARDHVPFARDIRPRRRNYAFSYKVLDRRSGDDFSHSQVQDATATNGEYRVKLPDGRLQIVSYTADRDGYKADVKYTQSEDNNDNRGKLQKQMYLQQKELMKVAAGDDTYIAYHSSATQTNHHQANYNEEKQQQQQQEQVNVVEAPTEKLHRNNGYLLVTPSPAGYTDGHVTAEANFQLPLPLNVQIFTTNARDYMVGSYVPILGGTQGSPVEQDYYNNNIIAPRIVNNAEHGIVLQPVSTPSSFVLADQNGQVIDNIKLVTSTAIPFVVSTTPAPFLYRRI